MNFVDYITKDELDRIVAEALNKEIKQAWTPSPAFILSAIVVAAAVWFFWVTA